jgi:hypothetical protein
MPSFRKSATVAADVVNTRGSLVAVLQHSNRHLSSMDRR